MKKIIMKNYDYHDEEEYYGNEERYLVQLGYKFKLHNSTDTTNYLQSTLKHRRTASVFSQIF